MRRSPFPSTQATAATISANDRVRKALAEHGDRGTAVRHVLHFFFPELDTLVTAERMIEELRTLGFEIDPDKSDGGVIAEEHREVASADFDSLTQGLTELASERGWKYDGFECAVEVHH